MGILAVLIHVIGQSTEQERSKLMEQYHHQCHLGPKQQ